MTRVLVCGGRSFGIGKPDEWLLMFRTLSAMHEKHYFTRIIEGGAPGADAGARTFGARLDIPVVTYEADWDRYGKGAGPIRNARMIAEGKPDLVIAFPGRNGTADMIKRARAAGIPVEIVASVDKPCGDRA